MAVLTVTAVGRTGVNLTSGPVAAAGGGDSFPNTGLEVLYVFNGHSGAQTVTAAFTTTVDGVAATSRVVSVPAGEARLIGPFPPVLFSESVALTYSGVTLLKVMPLKVTPNQ
jgi:hypothetical protein